MWSMRLTAGLALIALAGCQTTGSAPASSGNNSATRDALASVAQTWVTCVGSAFGQARQTNPSFDRSVDTAFTRCAAEERAMSGPIARATGQSEAAVSEAYRAQLRTALAERVA